MEEFFEKIKKKLSVDNILDLMKDGKLKEEIKQSLTVFVRIPMLASNVECIVGGDNIEYTYYNDLGFTATMNLNEKSKQEEVRSADISKNIMDHKNQITVENIQHTTTEDQTPVKFNEPHNLEEENEIQKKPSECDSQAENIELNETNKFLDKNEIQKKVSKPNLQAAIIELNESMNIIDKIEIKKKASKPNLIRPDTTEGSSTGPKLESTASGSIEETIESDKNSIRVLQKPLIMPSQTEQVESKTQFDDFLNLT